MRSTFLVILILAAWGCSKSAGITDAALRLPEGCKISRAEIGGEVECKDGSRLSWLERPSDEAGSLDKDEKIIRDALGAVETDHPACALAGAKAICRALRAKGKTVALLGYGTIGDRPYFVECAFQDATAKVPDACGVFSLL